jgi:dTMP kinase
MSGDGVFITFEGGEGTGKSTVITRVRTWLVAQGREVVVTREPGGTPVAEAVRSVLLAPSMAPDGLSELFLLEAARHDHVEQLIRPALARGAVVLSDRYADSSLVYQGVARGVPDAVVRWLNDLATGGLQPSRTVVLDLDPKVGLARVRQRADEHGSTEASRIDAESLDFHRRVREGFLALAAKEPDRVVVVDAAAAVNEVVAAVVDVVGEVLDG